MCSVNSNEINWRKEISSWVCVALQDENLKNIEVTIDASGETNLDGYMGNVVPADVVATGDDGERKVYSLIVKTGARNELLKKLMEVVFTREIDLYCKVIPAMRDLQKENDLEPFQSVPRCYFTKFSEDNQIIVLENLKTAGYGLYNKLIPMDLNHIKLILKTYGEFHALSLALNDQKPETFQAITKDWGQNNPIKLMMLSFFLGDWQNKFLDHVFRVLTDVKRFDLLDIIKQKVGKRSGVELTLDLEGAEKKQVVISHGDCWTNNYLFKYKTEDSAIIPKKLALIDFQMTTVCSPICDLSFSLYATASDNELQHFTELLNLYYHCVRDHLYKLGSNPEKVFSYEDFKRHWNDYALYGAILGCAAIICQFDDGLLTFENPNSIDALFTDLKEETKAIVTERLLTIIEHYVKYTI